MIDYSSIPLWLRLTYRELIDADAVRKHSTTPLKEKLEEPEQAGKKSAGYMHRLTDAQVRMIRNLGTYMPNIKIAQNMGISASAVSRVLQRRAYTHVE